MTIEAAYRACLDIARSHYENFPVASWLVPSNLRQPIAAIYAFARRADDVADEGDAGTGERQQVLTAFRQRLREPLADDPVDVALADTIRRFDLPLSVFDRLLDAFVDDTRHQAFTTWDQVMEYCFNSADPVGELLLRLDHAPSSPSEPAISASNAVCTALQITNFLQDAAIDHARGRQYLPLGHEEIIRRTYALFEHGRETLTHLRSRRLRWEVALTIAGGMTTLDLCAARVHQTERPTLGLRHAWHVVRRLTQVMRRLPRAAPNTSRHHGSNS
jgi:hydroxysqualene synthase